MKKNPWQTNSKEVVYDNNWIQVSHREVTNPSGNPGIYGVVHFKNLAIGIVVLDEDQNTWLVGQYRYALDVYSWEIPEGGGPLGTDPLASAKRELLEETGIIADKWTKIMDIHISNSVSDEVGILYLAENLSFGETAPEDTEDLKVWKLPFEEAYQMVKEGKITDSLSIMGIQKLKLILTSS